MITAVDGETVADPHELARRIAALGPKKTATLALIRNGAPMTIDVTLATMPADKTASAETGSTETAAATRRSALAKLGLTLRRNRGDGRRRDRRRSGQRGRGQGPEGGRRHSRGRGKAVSRPSEVAQAIDAAKSDGKKSVLIRVKSDDGEHFLALPTRAS